MEYGLIGEKLGHSFSKDIHEKIAPYTYELKEIAPEDVDAFMKERSFKAINVTIPYKQTVIPYLDEISKTAKTIGAVNVIVNKQGKLKGDNTDFAGICALIRRAKVEISGKKVLILGTGGTSKTARCAAASLGAAKIFNVSRSKKDGALSYEEAYEKQRDAQVIINTTPCGMFPKTEGLPADIEKFPALEGVIDVVYNPVETRLIKAAKAKGLPAEGGLYMLVAQAVYACGLFLEKEADETLIDPVYEWLLKEKMS